MKRIIVTGAIGQIGSELTLELRERYGSENVLATDIQTPEGKLLDSGPFEKMDCTNRDAIVETLKKFRPDTIYHLAALLSAVAEANPQKAWDVNINGLYYILEAAREYQCAVFTPSSISTAGITV